MSFIAGHIPCRNRQGICSRLQIPAPDVLVYQASLQVYSLLPVSEFLLCYRLRLLVYLACDLGYRVIRFHSARYRMGLALLDLDIVYRYTEFRCVLRRCHRTLYCAGEHIPEFLSALYLVPACILIFDCAEHLHSSAGFHLRYPRVAACMRICLDVRCRLELVVLCFSAL